ncbi:MAG: preprotein translocase subunit SecE [Chloroflexota bacterium]|tara:strand:+ start:237 stop:458 length:222 start_codon:yes stop_codon:yes gene_type:complete
MAANQNINSNSPRRSIKESFLAIWNELRKVTWPSRKEATRLTILVLAISGVIGAILSLVDLGFARLFRILTGT